MMSTILKTCVLGLAVLGLSACETALGNFDDQAPYGTERTAKHLHAAPEPAPAPEPVQCMCECSEWEARAMQAEHDLKMCAESKERVRDAFRDELKK